MMSENLIELLKLIRDSENPDEAVKTAYATIMDYYEQHPELKAGVQGI